MPQTRKEACSGNTLELRATAGEWQWIHPMRTPYDVPGGHLRWVPSLQCLNGITCLLKTRGKIWISRCRPVLQCQPHCHGRRSPGIGFRTSRIYIVTVHQRMHI